MTEYRIGNGQIERRLQFGEDGTLATTGLQTVAGNAWAGAGPSPEYVRRVTDPATGEKIVREDDVPFYKKQTRLVFGLNFKVDPEKMEDYLAIGGYGALGKALTAMKPEAIIQEVFKANLRGRGGGGFPAGWKWDSTRKAKGDNNPRCARRPDISLNATRPKPPAMTSSNVRIASVLGFPISWMSYSVGFRQATKYRRKRKSRANTALMKAHTHPVTDC